MREMEKSNGHVFSQSVFIFHLTCFWFTNFVRTIAKINDLHFNYLLDKTCPFSFFFKNEGIGFSLRPYIFNVYIYLCLFSLSLFHTHIRAHALNSHFSFGTLTYVHTYIFAFLLPFAITNAYILSGDTLKIYIKVHGRISIR